MHIATRIAAWVLAGYAACYAALLVALARHSGPHPMLLLLVPALAAVAAAWRIKRLQAGAARPWDLAIGGLLALAALPFLVAGWNTAFGGRHAAFWSARQAQDLADAALYMALPGALSGWIGWVFLRSGFRAVRAPRGPAR